MLQETGNTVQCKYCGSTSVFRCGSYNTVQRYLCRSCRRKFKPDQNAFYMRVPPEYVARVMEMYYRGFKITEIKTALKNDFGFNPSRAVLYRWIYNFSDRAFSYFKNYVPLTGDVWLIGEEIKKIADARYKTYDIIDLKTRFLLATQISRNRSLVTVKSLYEDAVQKAQKSPNMVTVFMVYSFFDKVKKLFKCQTEHVSMLPKELEYNLELIEFIVGFYDDRSRLLNRVKKENIFKKMLDGWNIHYNYLTPQLRLHGQTPAEAAGIQYPMKSWGNIIVHPGERDPDNFNNFKTV